METVECLNLLSRFMIAGGAIVIVLWVLSILWIVNEVKPYRAPQPTDTAEQSDQQQELADSLVPGVQRPRYIPQTRGQNADY